MNYKKILVTTMILTTFSLGACSSKKTETKSTQSDTNYTVKGNKISDTHEESNKASFQNGVLKTAEFTLKIDKTQIGHINDPAYGNDADGIIIWYTLTNTGKNNIVPNDIFQYFKIQQSDGNSLYDLGYGFDGSKALYPTYDNNGQELPEPTYSENLQKQEDMSQNGKDEAGLLPGKTVSTYQDFSLKDKEHDVVISLDPNIYPLKDKYTIKISD